MAETAPVSDGLTRVFDHTSLQKAVEEAIKKDVPEGKNNALVAVVTLDGTAELRFSRRIKGDWKIGGVIRRENSHGWDGGAVVIGSW